MSSPNALSHPVASVESSHQAPIKVAHSPDADDAFMFYALAKNLVDTEGLEFIHVLKDIETLNREALDGLYELTAISYHAYAYLHDKYALLTVGSSVGDGYGPIIVSKQGRPAVTKADFSAGASTPKTLAIPGHWTTAYLALRLWNPDIDTTGIQAVNVPFNEILQRVDSGEFDAGLIIHEGQLTYQDQGFQKVVDLGEWWQSDTGLPLPLGGNAIRRDLGPDRIQTIARVLKRSIQFGLDHRADGLAHAAQYSRGVDPAKIDRFVGMYVNDMTLEASADIQRGVTLLLQRGVEQGIIPHSVDVAFITV
jgi:1,4-dihydroxy-6-naphthoate synthase